MINIYIVPRTLTDESVVFDVLLSNPWTVDTLVFPAIGDREDAERLASNFAALINGSSTETASIGWSGSQQ